MTADDIVPAGSCAVLIGVSAYEYAASRRSARPATACRPCAPCSRTRPSARGRPSRSRSSPTRSPPTAWPCRSRIWPGPRRGYCCSTTWATPSEPARGPLCLTVTSTDPDQPDSSGLPWAALADVLRGSPAQSRLSILDCCVDGQATRTPAGDGRPGLAGITQIDGGYTLAAMTRADAALVPEPEQRATACTPFTGELRDVIAGGIPGGPPWLTFTDIYPVLRERLLARGLPAPGQSGTGTAREFAFTANAVVPGRPRPRRLRTGNPGARTAPPLDRAGALPPLDGADAVLLLDSAGGPSRAIPSRSGRAGHGMSTSSPRPCARPSPSRRGTRRHERWSPWPGRWRLPTLTGPPSSSPMPTASLSRSATRARRRRRWPPSPAAGHQRRRRRRNRRPVDPQGAPEGVRAGRSGAGAGLPPIPAGPGGSSPMRNQRAIRRKAARRLPRWSRVTKALAMHRRRHGGQIVQRPRSSPKAPALATSRRRWPPPIPTAPAGDRRRRAATRPIPGAS